MYLFEKIKKFLKILCHRMTFVGIALILQITVLLLVFGYFTTYSVWFYAFCMLLAATIALEILNKDTNPAYQIAWLIPIMLVPIFGVVIYLLFGRLRFSKKETALRKKISENFKHALCKGISCDQALEAGVRPGIVGQARYLEGAARSPIYSGCYTEFFPLGEDKFARMVDEIAGAKHFIFLEYFIVEEGQMWDTLLELLAQKAKEGVDVRVLYDDVGCLFTLPGGYCKKLREMGIKAHECNAFVPILTPYLNNRDHRKILVIDGHTAFTGGVNLADEYINAYEKYGHWKDSAVMVKGEAAESFTAMFLTMWDIANRSEDRFSDYGFDRYGDEMRLPGAPSGLIAPYGDSPIDGELVGENVYFNITSSAAEYLYIETPYLILDHDMETVLCNAAKKGVDVRIITPHIADKWFVHLVTQSYYAKLIKAGVKVYEYTPGFVHAKVFIADDEIATCGTVNLDYRSLYLHYECGLWMYKTACIADMKQDYMETLEKCQQMTLEHLDAQPFYKRLLRPVLRVFAPLM